MKKRLVYMAVYIFCAQCCLAQYDTAVMNDITRFQQHLVQEYAKDSTSPLNAQAKKGFKGIHFFATDTQYIITAKFVRTPNEKMFDMPTSGKITKQYIKYGEALFSIKGRPYRLGIYQSAALAGQRKYRNFLFIPFRDATSGKETYGGGRYIDLTIPRGDTVIINFNKAYHPYCAYTEGYNCPIPPRQNHIPVKIEAGVKY